MRRGEHGNGAQTRRILVLSEVNDACPQAKNAKNPQKLDSSSDSHFYPKFDGASYSGYLGKFVGKDKTQCLCPR